MNTVFLLFWIVCGVVTYGLTFGYYQREFSALAKEDYWRDLIFSTVFSLFGPISLFVVFISFRYKHGFKWI